MITKVQEQIALLDKKVDALMSRSLPEVKPYVKPPFQQPVHAQAQGSQAQAQESRRQHDHNQGRPMHRAICADCKKECEIPFKPRGDRPVYCKECFSRRKNGSTFKVIPDNKPKEAPSVPEVLNTTINIPEPPRKVKKKPAKVKKSVGKKKVVFKKKKK